MPRYIDADAFEVDCRKRYCTGCENYNGIKCKSCWIADMLDETDNAPTISPDEVRGVGKWLNDVGEFGFPEISCSVCGYKSGHYGFKYCPNCGAKMEVE